MTSAFVLVCSVGSTVLKLPPAPVANGSNSWSWRCPSTLAGEVRNPAFGRNQCHSHLHPRNHVHGGPR